MSLLSANLAHDLQIQFQWPNGWIDRDRYIGRYQSRLIDLYPYKL